MRTLVFLLAFVASVSALAVCAVGWPNPAFAQVSDAERAAARDLFKQGDELQRAGHFPEALDKFQRAQQVIQAPTNVLRIAECQAALTPPKLVEAAESYRTVIRWPLTAGSPPAFQSAIDQAKGELSQIEPRVPKVLVQTTPPSVPQSQMVIDGTAVPGALIGEPFPLDPGDHKVLVTAPGYSALEQTVTLRERETKTVTVEMHALSGLTGVTGSPPPVASGSAAPPPAPPPYGSSEPPPPPAEFEAPKAERKRPRTSILLGAHLGLEAPTGTIPTDPTIEPPLPGNPQLGDISGPGFAYGLDGGLRFLKNFYIGLTLEHAAFAAGKSPQNALNVDNVSSSTTAFGLVGALIVNPDRPSFYGEIALQERWYSFSTTTQSTVTPGTNAFPTQSYNSGEILFGVGLWLPVGQWLRLLPLATVALGTFNYPNGSSPPSDSGAGGHAFFMIGLEGLYNIDL